jgi:hypothetical protein
MQTQQHGIQPCIGASCREKRMMRIHTATRCWFRPPLALIMMYPVLFSGSGGAARTEPQTPSCSIFCCQISIQCLLNHDIYMNWKFTRLCKPVLSTKQIQQKVDTFFLSNLQIILCRLGYFVWNP